MENYIKLMQIEEIIEYHLQKYPQMQIQDVFKLLYQNEFGGEHLIEEENFKEYLVEEISQVKKTECEEDEILETIGNKIYRVYLYAVKDRLSVETLVQLCNISAQKQKGNEKSLLKNLRKFESMTRTCSLPFESEQVKQEIEDYQKRNFPSLHHSKEYRKNYHPHYRLISQEIAFYLPVFMSIEEKMRKQENTIVGIDGMAASGKTSLAKLLQRVYDCEIIHADDFFLQPYQRTEERFAEVGGNIDYERISEVLSTVKEGKQAFYRPYNCGTQKLEKEKNIEPQKLILVEGSYCLHRTMIDNYDCKIYLYCDEKIQEKRILERNGKDMLQRFVKEWIPMENTYAALEKIREKSDIALDTSEI